MFIRKNYADLCIIHARLVCDGALYGEFSSRQAISEAFTPTKDERLGRVHFFYLFTFREHDNVVYMEGCLSQKYGLRQGEIQRWKNEFVQNTKL